ncbi:MarR family transcriptional regulator [Staphylococcus delphini]|uniref:MarR family winged helix-turn-helix transcriptional regulator n=1 Tax=Staphylococcus delphini TaxID=53344 RepID=UPI001362AAAD|nr:MarR family transcriptional regulator [Staphylococcus delphini]NBK47786.1 MarR family transcriptional regulator [Staphylococcus delphini]
MDYPYQYLVRSLAHEMKHHADRKLNEFGITQEQSHTLGYLYRHQNERISQQDISTTFNSKGATISATVKKLEKMDLIYRTTDPSDSRRKILRLTDKGTALVDSFVSIFDEIKRIMVKDFSSEEEEQLKHYFDRMLANLGHDTK